MEEKYKKYLTETEFGMLKKFEAQIPYNLEQVIRVFVRLKSFGIDASKVAMTAWGNTAAALGKDIDDLVEAGTYATIGDYFPLRSFGIMVRVDGDHLAVTFRGITTRIENGTGGGIEKYLTDLGRNEFGCAMAARPKNFSLELNNIGDVWKNSSYKGETSP